MRGQVLYGRCFRVFLYHVPQGPLRDAISPGSAGAANARKTRPSLTPADASRGSMALLTQSGTGTVRMCRALLSISNDSPVVLPPLKVAISSSAGLSAAQPATQENS